MEGVCFWAIANGLGAHTDTLTSYEIGVQYQVSRSQSNPLQHHSLLNIIIAALHQHLRNVDHGNRMLQILHARPLHLSLPFETVPVCSLGHVRRCIRLLRLLPIVLHDPMSSNLLWLESCAGRVLQVRNVGGDPLNRLEHGS